MSDIKPMPSKIIPNTFQTPNLLTDDGLMSLLSGNEVKCYLVVIRKTFGWRKERDRIAKSQITKATGLSEPTVDDCMASLVNFGLVLCTADNNVANEGKEWSPQMDDSAIDYAGLEKRQTEAKKSSVKRTEKARLARGGVVQQPHLNQQPQGGVVQQPPQQPITASTSVFGSSGKNIFKMYEQEFGGLTPMIADAIKATEQTYPPDWIPEAMEIAVKKNIRTWDYVEGILRKCKAKNIRPSLNKLEAKNGNTGSNSRSTTKGKAGTRQKRAADNNAGSEYSAADLAAADLINRAVGVQ